VTLDRHRLPGYNDEDVPEDVLNYPGMMSRREKGMLYWLAKTHYDGEGLIVDAGLFLGASTNALASGIKAGAAAVKAATAAFKPINSYDTAVWVRSMNRYLTGGSAKSKAVQDVLKGRAPRPGESFLPILKEMLAEHLELIDFRVGDIIETASADRPIEIVFYDCLKTAERDAAAFRGFAPQFVPGKTIVVQQDYFYEAAPDLKVRQEFLAPYFSFLGAEATSAVFRLEKSLPEAYFRNDPIAQLAREEKVGLILRAAGRTHELKFRIYAQLSAVDFLAEHGECDRARMLLSDILRSAPASPGETFGPRMAAVLSTLEDRIAHS
jgi:hypothetical protein